VSTLVLQRFSGSGRITYPGVEHTTILSGALRMGYATRDDGPMETLTAGTLLITSAGTPHYLATTEETVVQTHGMGRGVRRPSNSRASG
jgi:uncharacterized cupin superfamily protein